MEGPVLAGQPATLCFCPESTVLQRFRQPIPLPQELSAPLEELFAPALRDLTLPEIRGGGLRIK